jgi:hypothetical protein
MPRNLLTDDAKLFVLQSLACYVSPSEVAKQVKEHFKITIGLPAILHYDPTKAQGRQLSEELKELFYELREKFKTDLDNIPCANAAYRLGVIQRVIEKAESQGNTAMVLQAAEQAAKERGGAYTNRRELTGKDGKPIETSSTVSATVNGTFDIRERAKELAQLPPDELMSKYRDAVGQT